MPDNEAGWMKAIADATTNVASGVTVFVNVQGFTCV